MDMIQKRNNNCATQIRETFIITCTVKNTWTALLVVLWLPWSFVKYEIALNRILDFSLLTVSYIFITELARRLVDWLGKSIFTSSKRPCQTGLIFVIVQS